MAKNIFFKLFRRAAKIFSGHGLRNKIPLINSLFKYLNLGLASKKITVFGNSMFLDSGDSMGLAINGIFEPKETALIQKLVNPGQVILDLGANIGYFTLLFARLVGPSGKVYAFEPHPVMFDILQKNVEINKFNNVLLFQNAVSDQSGKLILYVDKFYNLDHRIFPSENHTDGIEIEAVKIDEVLKYIHRVDFIKMDVQGAEILAIKGMSDLINRSHKMTLVTEFWPDGLKMAGGSAEEYFSKIIQFGFSIYDLEDPINGDQLVTIDNLLSRYPYSSKKHTNLLCCK